jgi:hypothetical protein
MLSGPKLGAIENSPGFPGENFIQIICNHHYIGLQKNTDESLKYTTVGVLRKVTAVELM